MACEDCWLSVPPLTGGAGLRRDSTAAATPCPPIFGGAVCGASPWTAGADDTDAELAACVVAALRSTGEAGDEGAGAEDAVPLDRGVPACDPDAEDVGLFAEAFPPPSVGGLGWFPPLPNPTPPFDPLEPPEPLPPDPLPLFPPLAPPVPAAPED